MRAGNGGTSSKSNYREIRSTAKYSAVNYTYGVGTLLRADIEANIRRADLDNEGRVQIVTINSPSMTSTDEKNSKLLAIINIYAVNGTTSPYFSATGKQVGTRHDRKLQFHSLLLAECLSLEKKGFDVVVIGDKNIARGRIDGHPNLRMWPAQHCLNRADFNAKFFSQEENELAGAYTTKEVERECLNAVDVVRALHGQKRKYTYYPRSREWGSGCDRVDLCFVSKDCWDGGRVLGADICNTEEDRGGSDHVPLWVEIKL